MGSRLRRERQPLPVCGPRGGRAGRLRRGAPALGNPPRTVWRVPGTARRAPAGNRYLRPVATLALDRALTRSEHPVLVDHPFGHFLADVPQLGNAVALEAEEMGDTEAAVAGHVVHVREHGDLVAAFDRAHDADRLVRELRRVVRHPCAQRRGVAAEPGVVVAEILRDVLLVSLGHAAIAALAQEVGGDAGQGAVVHGGILRDASMRGGRSTPCRPGRLATRFPGRRQAGSYSDTFLRLSCDTRSISLLYGSNPASDGSASTTTLSIGSAVVMRWRCRYSTFSSRSLPDGPAANTPTSTQSSSGTFVSLPTPSTVSLPACRSRVTSYLPSARFTAVAASMRLSWKVIFSNRSVSNACCPGLASARR